MRVLNSLSNTSPYMFSPVACLVTAPYDICKAFPTIAHVRLFAVPQAIELSQPLYNIISHLYQDGRAYSYGIGTNDFLFYMLAGVLTGCPLSAALF